MTNIVSGQMVAKAMLKVCISLKEQTEYITSLDQAIGDGDLGITMLKIADALDSYVKTNLPDDLGKFLCGAGSAINRAAPSTMGTLLGTALMRAGKGVMGKSELTLQDLAVMLEAANIGIQERGKAKLGDKTIIDAIQPASQSIIESANAGEDFHIALSKAIQASEIGRDRVIPLRSRIGRASWVGERTEGKVDPGTAVFVVILKALVGK